MRCYAKLRIICSLLLLVPILQGQNPSRAQTSAVSRLPDSTNSTAPPQPAASDRDAAAEAAGSGKKLGVPLPAQTFKFEKVDLDLLSEVNAFDKFIEEKGWIDNDPEINSYLKKIGLSFVPKETPENVTWSFRVIRDLEVNAFALPNGSIYVNSGLLSRMENEAQISGVLAHEVTHVTNRHGYLEYRSMRKKMVAVDVLQAAARVTPVGGFVGLGVANALGTLAPAIVMSTIFGYSRELEHEADVYAVNALYVQGYDLRQFSRGFELLRKGPEVDLSQQPVFWASHPKLASRVRYVAKMAEQLQPNPAGFRVDAQAYQDATTNVIRQNADLALLLGQPRTALAIARRLIADEPNDAGNFVLLGDAYRALGARTPSPDDAELSEWAKDRTRDQLHKMTMVEYDRMLFKEKHGMENWRLNSAQSDEAFHTALRMDPNNAAAHRGLGLLAERNDQTSVAIGEFEKYLQLAPSARDSRQIKLRIASLEKQASPAPAPAQSKSTR